MEFTFLSWGIRIYSTFISSPSWYGRAWPMKIAGERAVAHPGYLSL